MLSVIFGDVNLTSWKIIGFKMLIFAEQLWYNLHGMMFRIVARV